MLGPPSPSASAPEKLRGLQVEPQLRTIASLSLICGPLIRGVQNRVSSSRHVARVFKKVKQGLISRSRMPDLRNILNLCCEFCGPQMSWLKSTIRGPTKYAPNEAPFNIWDRTKLVPSYLGPQGSKAKLPIGSWFIFRI